MQTEVLDEFLFADDMAKVALNRRENAKRCGSSTHVSDSCDSYDLTISINKSCRRTASSPAGYILYCNIFIIKPYNIGHTDLDVFVCKSFCHIDIIIQV